MIAATSNRTNGKGNQLVNCTPHDINVYAGTDVIFDERRFAWRRKEGAVPLTTLPAPDIAARCANKDPSIEFLDGLGDIPIVTVRYNTVRDLPEPEEGKLFVVSSIVAEEAKKSGRRDLVIPHRLVKDASGRVCGCSAFSRA